MAGDGSRYIMSELLRRPVAELVKDLLAVSILWWGEIRGSPGRVALSCSFTIFPESVMESRIFLRNEMSVGIPRTWAQMSSVSILCGEISTVPTQYRIPIMS